MRPRPNRWLKGALNLALAAALLFAVSYLPPDTSLADRRKAGVLKLCVPPSYPPLVTGDPDRPGYDVELVSAIAETLGLRLVVNVLPSIGSDFNPRNWSLTRGQCDVIAGGVADTEQTRSFLQTIASGAETGWVLVSKSGASPAPGDSVAVLPGTSGLDRLQLSGWLREQSLRTVPVRSAVQLGEVLASGGVEAAILERFVAGTLRLDGTWQIGWLPEDRFAHYRMALGLWKGDQTLKSAISQSLQSLTDSGKPAEIGRRYGVQALAAPSL